MPDDEIDYGTFNFSLSDAMNEYEKILISEEITKTDELRLYIIANHLVIIVTDEDGDKVTYWKMPNESTIPDLDYTEKDGKEYMAVIWNNPKDANLKTTEVNDHLVYSGCSFDELIKKNGKMKCKEPLLFMVLHPKEEWESYHIRNLKA